MQDTHRVQYVPRARRDLIEIFDRVAKDSPQNAVGLLRTLTEAADSLAFMPRRFKVFKPDRRPDRVVRALSCPPYIIYYREAKRGGHRPSAARPPRGPPAAYAVSDPVTKPHFCDTHFSPASAFILLLQLSLQFIHQLDDLRLLDVRVLDL